MSFRYSCFLDADENNWKEYAVSGALRSFRFVRAMDMVTRMQTVGRLEAVFESYYDDDFLKLFKHGRSIGIRVSGDSIPFPGRYPLRNLYAGYIREVRRLSEGKFAVTADYALAWLHNDDDTASYTNISSNRVIHYALSRGSILVPWHQNVVNPQGLGLAPGTYDYAVVGESVVGDMTLVGAYYPRGHLESSYQMLRHVDAIVLDVDSTDRSGSLYSLLSKAVLSEAGYLYVDKGGLIQFRGRYGRTFAPEGSRRQSLTSWDGADFSTWEERVSELTVLLPNRKARQSALFETGRNFHVPAGNSFFQFESYAGDFPVEIKGNVRVEGLPDDVQCFPSFSDFHLYLRFENASGDLAVIEELSIYADVVEIQSVSRRTARTGFRGGRQVALEFADLGGDEDVLLSHYIRGLQAQNELGSIYLTGLSISSSASYNLMHVIDLNNGSGGIDESAYIQSIEWTYGEDGSSLVKIGLWPFVDYNYALVGKTGFEEVGQVVVGI